MTAWDSGQGELALIRIRRAEIAAHPQPHIYKDEYIRLMRREVDILKQLKLSHDTGCYFRAYG